MPTLLDVPIDNLASHTKEIMYACMACALPIKAVKESMLCCKAKLLTG
jgi:hypothetical protein